MLRLRGAVGWLGFAMVAALVAARGAERGLPPVTGELEGKVVPLVLPGAPALQWKLALRGATAPGERVADLAIDGPGVRAQGEARLTAPGEGTWRITDGRVNVAQWLPLLAAKYFSALAGTRADGEVMVNADGTIRDGKVSGRATIAVRDGVLRDPNGEWNAAGISVDGLLGQLPALVTDGTAKITFRELDVAGLQARHGTVELAIDAEENVHVARATWAMLEGTVEVTPFAFSLAKPEVRTDVHFHGIELSLLHRFLPTVLSAARGKVSGRMAIAWNAKTGFSPGSGRLQIDRGAAASVRLAPTPGFLTSRVPPRLSLLPTWLGPVARAFSPPNPAYETLRAIEMGEMNLEVNSLDIGLRPEGDPEGRTARVVITARPARQDVVKTVRFEINVSGPLADVIRLGLEGRFKVR